MQIVHTCRLLGLLAFVVLFGVSVPAQADIIHQVGDATYGTSAIDITFSWDGNVNDPLTNFIWSTPLSDSAIYGTVTNADVVWWDDIGFPDGITNLAVYLLSGEATWSEDCTGPPPTGGVSPAFCGEPGSRIDLSIRDTVVGTYGFQLNRELDLARVDVVTSGTLVGITTTPEPAMWPVLGAGLLLLFAMRRRYISVDQRE
ncbi:MAG: PEP-CTERM sorting domain-containing protein [Bryobacteraceae bacterium]